MPASVFHERKPTMGNKQKDKTKKTDQIPASRNIDLAAYEFTYRSEPTFVVPLFDFISGLAPLQSPIIDKKEMEQNKNKSRFIQELLSHELVEAFSFNSSKLSKKFRDLGGMLGFTDNISHHVLNDAGIKLNKFYWRVYLTYAITCLVFIIGFAYWFVFNPSVTPYITPTASPTASPIVPTNTPPSTSTSAPTNAPSGTSTSPTNTPPGTSTSVPTNTPPSASPTPTRLVAPLFGENPGNLVKFSILLAPLSVLLGFIFIFIIIRLGILVAGRVYASTLCLLACIYIILELEQDDILSIDRLKKRLLNRIDFLARYIPLVGTNFSHGDPSVREWTSQYFRTIQNYVHHLERRVIAPKSDTLQELREDFYKMAGVLLYGNYDEIDWKSDTRDKVQTPAQRIGSIFQGFISIGIPILLLAVVIFNPGLIPASLGTEKISLIAIAWFLIAVDVNLRLGVIDRVLDIAKAIKELK